MIIVTNGTYATMYYSESQWLDVQGVDLGENAHAYRAANTTSISEILGAPEMLVTDEAGLLKIVEATGPMSHAEVEALATEQVLRPSLTKD
jgi:hypothetical protein